MGEGQVLKITFTHSFIEHVAIEIWSTTLNSRNSLLQSEDKQDTSQYSQVVLIPYGRSKNNLGEEFREALSQLD